MAKEVKRIFNISDEDMLVRAEKFHKQLDDGDLAAFTLKFPWLDSAWHDTMKTDITACKNFPENEEVVGDIKELTASLQTSMVNGERALDTLDVYARLAYPADAVRQRIFGQDRWAEAKGDNEKMVEALQYAYRFANKEPYKAALQGKGMAQGDIDQLNTLSTEVDNRNNLQEHAKGEQPVTTQDRITFLNIVYGHMQTLNICADLVYRDNYAKQQQYKLGSSSAVNTTVQVLVRDATTPQADVVVTPQNVDLAAKTTDATGIVEFQSINMPDSLKVKTQHPTLGEKEETFGITLGEVNEVVVVY